MFNESRVLITGGAGFLGSHAVDFLLSRGANVTCLDNLCTGRLDLVQQHSKNSRYSFKKIDLLNDENLLASAFEAKDFIFHFAANADVRGGVRNTRIDLEQNTIATYNVLEAMRKNDVKNICFTSSAAVYGDALVIPTPEDYAPIQNSLYGASKLACEAMIQAYSNYYGMHNWIYRFCPIIGERCSHGVVVDFVAKLRKNTREIEILGDGNQVKSFLYASDYINGIFTGLEKAKENTNIFNL